MDLTCLDVRTNSNTGMFNYIREYCEAWVCEQKGYPHCKTLGDMWAAADRLHPDTRRILSTQASQLAGQATIYIKTVVQRYYNTGEFNFDMTPLHARLGMQERHVALFAPLAVTIVRARLAEANQQLLVAA